MIERIHILPGTLARSPGHVSEQWPTPMRAVRTVAQWLAPLPPALRQRWLSSPAGHIVLNPDHHGFVSGPQRVGARERQDVAWLKPALLPDRAAFLLPVGEWLVWLIGWGEETPFEPALKAWDQFESGVRSCFRAGYGLSPAARSRVDAYLAEGAARYLADRRGLNLDDPRLEKLLRATLFNQAAYG